MKKSSKKETKESGKSSKPRKGGSARPVLAISVPAMGKKTSPQRAKPAAPPVARKPKRRIGARPPAKGLKVPDILLEGDAPAGPSGSGPGLRYALAPQPVGSGTNATVGELPAAYGTGRIFLAARDPHWLYASWDFTPEQQKDLNARSRDGHMVLRVFAEGEEIPCAPEVHVHPESRNWFVNVPRAETRYRAEIGFYEGNGAWRSVSVSQSTFAPPEAPSKDVSAEFATIPPQISFKQVIEVVEQFVSRKEGQPLLEAVAEAQGVEERAEVLAQREEPERVRPAARDGDGIAPARRAKKRPAIPVRIEPGAAWNQERRAALKRLIQMDERRRVFIGSIEITELVRRELQEEELASIAAREGRGVSPELGAERVAAVAAGISSPLGGERPKARRFWFKVNAELIVYGATEPDAKVTVAERQIKLRPDGSFSFRFSLPDGRYELPAVAVSGDGEEARGARLEFARSTEYRGEVEAHPQDAALKPPNEAAPS